MRKLVVWGLVTLLILGFGATGYAADWNGTFVNPAFTDIAGHDAEEALTILASLGIYSGETGVGRAVQPDDLITRAQFCKIVIIAVGREKTAQGLKGLRPEFKDEIPTWAWGCVNTAVYTRVINGYEDGTFRAAAPVTYAEVCAMSVRAVPGHLAQVPRFSWPYNFLFYASDNGFADGVDIGAANLPATRGDIARMTWAMMGVPRLNKDGVKIVGSEILFERYFEGYLTGYDLKLGEVSVAEPPQDPGQNFALGTKVFLLGARGPESLRNLRVGLVLDARKAAGGKVVFVGPVEDARSFSGVYRGHEHPSSGPYNYLVFEGGAKLPFEKGKLLDTTLNNNSALHADSLEAGDLCAVALNEHGLAVHVTASRENLGKSFVTAVHPGPHTGSVTVTVFHGGALSTYVTEKTAKVTLNGRAAAPGDLAVDDVVYLASYGADPDEPVIAARAVRSVVEGELRDGRTVYSASGHVHYCTLRLTTGVTKEYKVDHSGNLPEPPWVVGSRGRYGLDADGALFVRIGYKIPTPHVLVTSYVSGSTHYVTADQRGQEVSYLIEPLPDHQLYPFAQAVGHLGRLLIDPNDNRAYGFTAADFTGSPWYDVLAVDPDSDALTLRNQTSGGFEFVPDAVVYRWEAAAQTYVYAPAGSIQLTWDLRRDQASGSKLYLYHQPTVTVTFGFPDGQPKAGTEFSLLVTTRIKDDGAVPDGTLLRYRAILKRGTAPVASQVIKYLEAGQTWAAPSTITTDAGGQVYFGPAGGFSVSAQPNLLGAGVTTEFRSTIDRTGTYTLTLTILDVTGSNSYPLGSGSLVFGVSG